MGMATIRVLVLLMCVWISSAEIRETDVIQQSRSLLLDVFEFSDAGGGIELNVTEIDIASSLSVPIIDADLSTIGFFLSAKEALMDLAIDLETTSCFFEWPHKNYFQVLFTFNELKLNQSSFSLVFNLPQQHGGVYELLFQNCLSHDIQVSMKVRSSMFNVVDGHMSFLSPYEVSQIPFLIVLLILYLILLAIKWVFVQRLVLFGCDSYMEDHFFSLVPNPGAGVAMILKIVSLCFDLLRRVHINNTGYSQDLWSLLAILSHLLEEVSRLTFVIGEFKVEVSYMSRVFVVAAQFALAFWKFGIAGQGPCGVGCIREQLVYRALSFFILSFLIISCMDKAVRSLVLGGLAKREAGASLPLLYIVEHYGWWFLCYMLFTVVLDVTFEGSGSSWLYTYFFVREVSTLALHLYLSCLQIEKEAWLIYEITEADEEEARKIFKDRVALQPMLFGSGDLSLQH